MCSFSFWELRRSLNEFKFCFKAAHNTHTSYVKLVTTKNFEIFLKPKDEEKHERKKKQMAWKRNRLETNVSNGAKRNRVLSVIDQLDGHERTPDPSFSK